MQDFMDSSDYLNSKRPSRRGRFVVIAALLLFAFIVTRIVLSDWVDLLWFKTLGDGDVFCKTFVIESSVFPLCATVTFLVLCGAFFMIRRSHHPDLPTNHAIVVSGQPISLSVAPALRIISLVVSIVGALLTGLTMMSQWPPWPSSGTHRAPRVPSPILSFSSTQFFLFTLPA